MTTDNFKINLNQNLWVLIVGLLTLGSSEYYELRSLYFFGIIISSIASVSILISLTYYTIKYCKKKL